MEFPRFCGVPDHVYQLPADEAEHYLRTWCRGAKRSRLRPIIDFARMVDEYWLGIVRWFESRITNGLLEGLNSLVQAAKRRARGLPLNTQLHRDDLPHRRQARHRHPHEVARSPSMTSASAPCLRLGSFSSTSRSRLVRRCVSRPSCARPSKDRAKEYGGLELLRAACGMITFDPRVLMCLPPERGSATTVGLTTAYFAVSWAPICDISGNGHPVRRRRRDRWAIRRCLYVPLARSAGARMKLDHALALQSP